MTTTCLVLNRLGLGLLGLVLFSLSAHAAIIAGPTLTFDELGHTGHGIMFTALQDSSLIGFQFSNQGAADSITLMDITAASQVGSYGVAAGNPVITISVNWALTAGHNYYLIGNTTSNGRWAIFGGFPVANSDISVTSGYFSGPFGSAWGSFNNIETTSRTGGEIPEPSTLALMAAGVAFLALGVRRRKPHGTTC